MVKTCPICGEVFLRPVGKGTPHKKFCSEDCKFENYNRRRRLKRGNAVGSPMKTKNGETKQSKRETVEKIDLSPAGWAAWVFKNYELDGSQQQLVMMGLEILTVARDSEEDLKTRMAAMGRFQAIISQLNLPKLDVEEEEIEPETVVTASCLTIDPRKQLRA